MKKKSILIADTSSVVVRWIGLSAKKRLAKAKYNGGDYNFPFEAEGRYQKWYKEKRTCRGKINEESLFKDDGRIRGLFN